MSRTSEKKTRIIVLTDIARGFEIDDIESLIRLLVYSNEFKIEALIATTSCWYKDQGGKENKEIIIELIDAYEKVKNNLELHSSGYPEADELRRVSFAGIPKFGAALGDGWGEEWMDDLPCISHFINVIDRQEPQPVWILIWGGANVLAHAVWRVSRTRSREQLAKFLSKLRVYAISDQDGGGIWLRENFGDHLFYIVSPSPGDQHGDVYYRRAVWPGISGDMFKHGSPDGYEGGGFNGANNEMVSNAWLRENIVAKGPLGEKYPEFTFLMEGDTPSFLHLIPNGLGDPEHPNYGSWGGRYEYYIPESEYTGTDEKYPLWTNAWDTVRGEDGVTYSSPQASIWRWREAYQNDFAARMDWTITSDYKNANHPPIPKLDHPNYFSVKSKETVKLSAKGSTDPDGNDLSFNWLYYKEAGTYSGNIIIHNAHSIDADFTAPEVSEDCTIHIILTVKDSGSPPLCRYERVIIRVHPA